MKTIRFLMDYLRDTAQVTICSSKDGAIMYEGELGEMPVSPFRGTVISRIEGLGSNDDIIIEVAPQS